MSFFNNNQPNYPSNSNNTPFGSNIGFGSNNMQGYPYPPQYGGMPSQAPYHSSGQPSYPSSMQSPGGGFPIAPSNSNSNFFQNASDYSSSNYQPQYPSTNNNSQPYPQYPSTNYPIQNNQPQYPSTNNSSQPYPQYPLTNNNSQPYQQYPSTNYPIQDNQPSNHYSSNYPAQNNQPINHNSQYQPPIVPPSNQYPSNYPPQNNQPINYPPQYEAPTVPSVYNQNLQTNNQSLYPSLNTINSMSNTTRVFNPTLRPFQPFNPHQDAERLYKAMKGFGTDESTLIDILCKRTSAQRLEIALCYKTGYGKDLIKNIESETSGDFETLLVTLLTRPMAIEAQHLRESVQGMGTNEANLIDVICTKTNSEMMELKSVYHQIYRRNLEDDVKDDVSGYFKRLLVSLMSGHRSENAPDQQKAAQQARELYEAGEKQFGTNEVAFNRIFSIESYAHLRLVFDEYQKLTGHPIERAIKTEMSTSVERAFLSLIQFVRSPSMYFAQRLHEAMAGAGTKDKLLIRIMVLRSEIDLMDIKIEFQKRYGKSLESFIKSDTSGDYKRGLLCLAGDPKWK